MDSAISITAEKCDVHLQLKNIILFITTGTKPTTAKKNVMYGTTRKYNVNDNYKEYDHVHRPEKRNVRYGCIV